mgnify:CR=1 FL=1
MTIALIGFAALLALSFFRVPIAFTMIISKISSQGLDLRPYVFTQILIVLGCMSVISFSPQYPRLMFSLIWNIFFALFQISIAVSLIVFNKFLHLSQHHPLKG